MGGLTRSRRSNPQPAVSPRVSSQLAPHPFYRAGSGVFKKSDLPQEVYASQNVHAQRRLDSGGKIPLNPGFYAAKNRVQPSVPVSPSPVIRYVQSPAQAPVRAPSPVLRNLLPVTAAVQAPVKPQFRRSATGRFVLDEPGKKRVLGRGKKPTILTSPQGDLGGGSDMDLRKPKLGG